MNFRTARWLGCLAGLALAAGSAQAQVRPATPAARFFSLDAWCEREADRLRAQLHPPEPLRLEGLGRDWLVGAVAIQSQEAAEVTVDLEGPAPLRAAANLKGVGEMRGPVRDGQVAWWLDALFSAPPAASVSALKDPTACIRNWPVIREFPRLHLQPQQPVMLWLTVKTHGLPPGLWEGRIAAVDAAGGRIQMPFRVRVGPVDLPEDNPIVGFAWTPPMGNQDMLRTIHEYGINASGGYGDWELCRELGYRYFKFRFPGSPSGPPEEVTDDWIKEKLRPIREKVAELRLQAAEWGLEIFDEPTDTTAAAYVAWMKRLRQVWPAVQFWANPAYVPPQHPSTPKGLVEPMKPFVTTWCPYFESLSPGFLKALKETGQPVWYYWITRIYDRPATGGRRTPWLAWKLDLDGWAFFALSDTSGAGDPWQDNLYAHSYPENTVTLWMEGLRQGVQDYKRLWLLRKQGRSREQLAPLVDRMLPSGRHAPWQATDAKTCTEVRAELDRMLLQKDRDLGRTLDHTPIKPLAMPAQGPLRVHPTNPRYFTDGTKLADGSLKAVFLTGSHTWNNLVDMGRDDPPERFDYQAYLGFLEQHGHNFIRLWAWDSTTLDTRGYGRQGKDFVHHAAPQPWARTGPGVALDGKPKFDLTRFNPEYFERLRARVRAAGERGIYVSVMLFEGWGMMHGSRGPKPAPEGWPWRAHPFHRDNNINGDADGDDRTGEVHTRTFSAVNAIQADYIRKVVDTLNDLDNVLYEVINEGGQKDWDWWVIQTVREHERKKPKQHPLGLTGHGAERLKDMLASEADWVSPGRLDGYAEDPPAWTGKKVSLLDTDHIWGMGGNADWVWKAFTRGHNPLFMDQYQGAVFDAADRHAQWDELRRALGHTRRLAGRVNLATMTPHDEMASTKYCLANPGVAYIVYLPQGGAVTVDLAAVSGTLAVEWVSPVAGGVTPAGTIDGGAKRSFKPPFEGDAVLHLNGRTHNSK